MRTRKIPAISMGNSGIGGDAKKEVEPKNEIHWRDEALRAYDSYLVKPGIEEAKPEFTDDDTLFKRVNFQMRKRELPGMLGPLPMDVGSVENLKINQDFELERR